MTSDSSDVAVAAEMISCNDLDGPVVIKIEPSETLTSHQCATEESSTQNHNQDIDFFEFIESRGTPKRHGRKS